MTPGEMALPGASSAEEIPKHEKFTAVEYAQDFARRFGDTDRYNPSNATQLKQTLLSENPALAENEEYLKEVMSHLEATEGYPLGAGGTVRFVE